MLFANCSLFAEGYNIKLRASVQISIEIMQKMLNQIKNTKIHKKKKKNASTSNIK